MVIIIFDNIIYPDNKNKKEKIKIIEQELSTLFSNYSIAWNNFCEQIDLNNAVPKLQKSLKTNSLTECIDEIDHATKTLDNIIKNATEKLESANLFTKTDYTFKTLQPVQLQEFIKYTPLLAGGLTGLGITSLVYRAKFHNLHSLQKSDAIYSAFSEIFSNELNEIHSIYTTMDFNNLTMTSNKLENLTYNKVFKLYNEYIHKIQNSPFKTLLYERGDTFITQGYNTINGVISNILKHASDMNQQPDAVSQFVLHLKDSLTMDTYTSSLDKTISSAPSLPSNSFDIFKNFAKENTSKQYKNTPLLPSTKEKLELFNANNIAKHATLSKSEYFIISTIGIVITIASILIFDAIICCIEGYFLSKQLTMRLQDMNNILGELTVTMTKETINIVQLTQNLKDGTIWLDKHHMLLVDKETYDTNLIHLSEIN
ncbi:MAG: hypothetical protein ACRCSG_03960 [Cellulosilyticaceae bacterium]